jgi:PAS domain S-box-containing protein
MTTPPGDNPKGSARRPTGTGAPQTPTVREAADYLRSGGSQGVRAEGEGLYRLLVESVQDYAIFALDSAGYIISWNIGAERLKGYTVDEILGKHFSIFYPPEDLARGKPPWELEVAAREGRLEDEGWRLRKDGTRFWANVIITALRGEEGELVGFAKVTRDLTERRAAHERALADTRRLAEAEAANRAKADFLAAMSHELRTPLNAVGGYAELMELGVGGPVTDRQREYLARIRGSQQHLLGIINDLLNYSRIEAGQVAYDLAPVRVHDVVEVVLAMVAPQAVAKGLQLERGPCPEGMSAWADRTKAEQITLNLLSNAVKFTPAGGRVVVACGASDERVFISVRDTGPGIPPDKLDAIFEPFVQLGRSLKSAHEGTGLGLAISRDLARAMGGDVTVESALGAGAIFTLLLPQPESSPTPEPRSDR